MPESAMAARVMHDMWRPSLHDSLRSSGRILYAQPRFRTRRRRYLGVVELSST